MKNSGTFFLVLFLVIHSFTGQIKIRSIENRGKGLTAIQSSKSFQAVNERSDVSATAIFNKDNTKVYVTDIDGNIFVFDVGSGNLLKYFNINENRTKIKVGFENIYIDHIYKVDPNILQSTIISELGISEDETLLWVNYLKPICGSNENFYVNSPLIIEVNNNTAHVLKYYPNRAQIDTSNFSFVRLQDQHELEFGKIKISASNQFLNFIDTKTDIILNTLTFGDNKTIESYNSSLRDIMLRGSHCFSDVEWNKIKEDMKFLFYPQLTKIVEIDGKFFGLILTRKKGEACRIINLDFLNTWNNEIEYEKILKQEKERVISDFEFTIGIGANKYSDKIPYLEYDDGQLYINLPLENQSKSCNFRHGYPSVNTKIQRNYSYKLKSLNHKFKYGSLIKVNVDDYLLINYNDESIGISKFKYPQEAKLHDFSIFSEIIDFKLITPESKTELFESVPLKEGVTVTCAGCGGIGYPYKNEPRQACGWCNGYGKITGSKGGYDIYLSKQYSPWKVNEVRYYHNGQIGISYIQGVYTKKTRGQLKNNDNLKLSDINKKILLVDPISLAYEETINFPTGSYKHILKDGIELSKRNWAWKTKY